jgi:pimeloyl-ACP methyl ester carboxylesterase
MSSNKKTISKSNPNTQMYMSKNFNLLKKIITYLVILSIALVILGFTYEQVSRQIVINKYPVQGNLVDLGNGRKMQIDCRGVSKQDIPIVILESGFDYYGSLSWYKVQDEIAKTTQVCSYSRAGIMWSDPDPRDYNATNIATDLNLLLQKSNITGPIVMASHSLGGPLIMKYIQLYPNQVKGLVFVDTSHPDEIEKGKVLNKELNLPTVPQQEPPQLLINLGSELGVLRLFKIEQNAKDLLPEPLSSIANAYTSKSLPTILKGSNNIEKIITASGEFRNLGDRPMIQLGSAKEITATDEELKVGEAVGWTSERFENFKKKNQEFKDSLATERNTWSTNSKYTKVTDAEHYIQLDNPEIIIKSIIEVLESVKNSTKL